MATTTYPQTGHHNIGKGILKLEHPVPGAFRDVGECREFKFNITTEDKPLYSGRSGFSLEVDNAYVKMEGAGSFVLLDQNIHNAQLFSIAKDVSKTSQVADTGLTGTIIARHDLYVPLVSDFSEIDFENVIIKDETETTTYTESTDGGLTGDYVIDYDDGMIKALAGGTITDEEELHITSYDIKEATFLEMYAGTDDLYEGLIYFKGQQPKGRKKDFMCYASISPNGDIEMISDDYANFGFNFKMLDKNKLPGNNAGLYWYRDRGVVE